MHVTNVMGAQILKMSLQGVGKVPRPERYVVNNQVAEATK